MSSRVPALSLVLLLVIRIAVAQEADTDHWYEYSIGEVPCGYLHRTVHLEDSVVVTRTVEALHIKRNGVSVRLTTEHRFRELVDGTPLDSDFTQIGNGNERSSSIVFSDRAMRITTSRARGEAESVQQPLPEGWLTPREATSLIRERIASGAGAFDYRLLRRSSAPGTLQQVRMERLRASQAPGSSTASDASCWRVDRAGESLALLEWRDANGVLLESRMDTGLGALRSILSTKDRALRALAEPAPELMRTTVVEACSMPPASERIVTAGYHVRLDVPPGMPKAPPSSAGAQRVRMIDDQLFEFEIDASRGSPATEHELNKPVFREPSRVLDSSDPELVAFTAEVLVDAPDDPHQRAELLRVAVDRHIHRKSLASGLDTASEVLRSRSGDCTEHAMLLAAAFRADGIPSRVAIGLVHTELGGGMAPAFVWHMWTQGLIDGHWYDFDCTRPRRFDGGHLLIDLDPLADDGGGQRLSSLLGLVGRLHITAIMIDGRAVGEERSPG
ncbi:MAG: transglutaminase-like domain-containing protein [Planctomycetota bacterium]|nr:transglutaminase-like domain-containing protein [Planctomycetota bacterium]